MDALAVSVAVGVKLCQVNWRQVVRMAGAFGFFQFGMPLIGWLAGMTVADKIHSWDHWVAFGLLTGVGMHMIWSGWKGKENRWAAGDPTRGLLLLSLAVATSIDALAVGVGFSFLQAKIWMTAALIGLVAATMTAMGIKVGCRLGLVFGKRMEISGGVILVVMGVKFLLEHYFTA